MTDAPAERRDPTSPAEYIDAAIFDTDGVVTRTAEVHRRAWRAMFDEYLRDRQRRFGEPFEPFSDEDYRLYVDGKPRTDGVVSFLASRGIRLDIGDPDAAATSETARGLGTRKNVMFLADIAEHGVEAYPSTVALVQQLRVLGVRTAVVSASENCARVLTAAGVASCFDVKVDGTDLARMGLPGKPDPALFLEAARRLEIPPVRCAVVEDALSGVEAGRRGGFGLVIGVDRTGHAGELLTSGADVVVGDLSGFEVDGDHAWKLQEPNEPHER